MPDETQVTDQPAPQKIIAQGYTFGTVTDQIATVVLTKKTPVFWMASFALGIVLLLLFLLAVGVLLLKGVGVWGLRTPVMWGFAITNFVWWIGIGHAGTLISAILLLLHQKWRNSINRFAETMTLLAVSCAGLFPLLHLGRPYKFYYLFPYPDKMDLWPQWRSPLVWDVFAVSTYF
ncbi:MAG TPA: NrfD/PsrC family molybdoenzyme membrane anchor subunit, partial [Verrucomicrobiae bacterium]|nr:NrfD/PsrC family molybdoenzyme membrane anchor subunit [Verrucomicrobiae bacterium]